MAPTATEAIIAKVIMTIAMSKTADVVSQFVN
jgi:hypothetical protein